MKISMEIKDGKIILTDEQFAEIKHSTETITTSPNTFTGTGINLNNIKTVKDILNNEDVTKKEFLDTIVNDTTSDKLTNPNRFNTGTVAITMSTIDRPDIDQIADIDKDIPGYDRIRVFDSMEKKCDITVINDGYKPSNENEEVPKDSDAIHFIVNRTGIEPEEESWSQAEITLYPGEAWKIYDVYELRIRSEMQGTRYRVTEDDIIATSTIRSVS